VTAVFVPGELVAPRAGDAPRASGARRTVLTGYGHRPQDHADADAPILEHWGAA